MRPMIRYLKKNYPSELIGVEIGVFKGNNALDMLRNLPIKHLYLVDPCEYYQGYEEWQDITHIEACDIALEKLMGYEDKITFIIKKAEDAGYDIPNELDFVYIDGNHDYEYVTKDIELYYPKIKSGGVVGGHDIILNSVRDAVNDFCSAHGLDYYEQWLDWWIIL